MDAGRRCRVAQTAYVLNGPNLNLLGKRQPEIYGRETLADVEAECRRQAGELGLGIEFRQSNREYEIIDWIHEARERGGFEMCLRAANFSSCGQLLGGAPRRSGSRWARRDGRAGMAEIPAGVG